MNKIHAAIKGVFDTGAARIISNWIGTNDSPRTIYHLHGWAQTLSPSIFHSLAKVHERVILHAHDYFLLCPNGAFYEYPSAKVCKRAPLSVSCLSANCDKRSYGQKLWRCARQMVLRSLFDIASMPARILLIHQGMAPPFIRSGVPKEKFLTLRNPITPYSAKRIHAEENRDVLFIGRIQEEKGIEDLIAAVKITGHRLVVIGDGPLKNILEDKHPDIFFQGWKDRDSIGVLVRHVRLLVMPSRYPEPFGLVCLEAAGSGIPVIVPPSALLAGDVAAFGIGYVCNTRDHGQLAATLQSAMDDDAAIKQMSETAYALAGRLAPSPADWGEQLRVIYENAIPVLAT